MHLADLQLAYCGQIRTTLKSTIEARSEKSYELGSLHQSDDLILLAVRLIMPQT